MILTSPPSLENLVLDKKPFIPKTAPRDRKEEKDTEEDEDKDDEDEVAEGGDEDKEDQVERAAA